MINLPATIITTPLIALGAIVWLPQRKLLGKIPEKSQFLTYKLIDFTLIRKVSLFEIALLKPHSADTPMG